MAQPIQREPAFLQRKQVETRTGLSRSTIYQYIKDGAFPKPFPLGRRAVGWLESDVSEWIAGRVRSAQDGSPNKDAHAGGPMQLRPPGDRSAQRSRCTRWKDESAGRRAAAREVSA